MIRNVRRTFWEIYHCRSKSIFVFMSLLLVIVAYQMPCALAAQEDKEIIAGVIRNFPPESYIDKETGKPVGFAIDIMDEIARLSKLKVRYVMHFHYVEFLPNLC